LQRPDPIIRDIEMIQALQIGSAAWRYSPRSVTLGNSTARIKAVRLLPISARFGLVCEQKICGRIAMRSIPMITRNLALAVLMVALSTLGPQRASAVSTACTTCRLSCQDDYPHGGGPLQTCLNLCTRNACGTTSNSNLTNPSGATTTIQKKHIGQPKYEAVGPAVQSQSKGPLNTPANPALQGNVLQKGTVGGSTGPTKPPLPTSAGQVK
jgi:hypothetical protein